MNLFMAKITAVLAVIGLAHSAGIGVSFPESTNRATGTHEKHIKADISKSTQNTPNVQTTDSSKPSGEMTQNSPNARSIPHPSDVNDPLSIASERQKRSTSSDCAYPDFYTRIVDKVISGLPEFIRQNTDNAIVNDKHVLLDGLLKTGQSQGISKQTPCPWEYVPNHHPDRQPGTIAEARCIREHGQFNGQETANKCSPVYRNIKVLWRTGCHNGQFTYKYVWEKIAVACSLYLQEQNDNSATADSDSHPPPAE